VKAFSYQLISNKLVYFFLLFEITYIQEEADVKYLGKQLRFEEQLSRMGEVFSSAFLGW
jgi:hypothetical protein